MNQDWDSERLADRQVAGCKLAREMRYENLALHAVNKEIGRENINRHKTIFNVFKSNP